MSSGNKMRQEMQCSFANECVGVCSRIILELVWSVAFRASGQQTEADEREGENIEK